MRKLGGLVAVVTLVPLCALAADKLDDAQRMSRETTTQARSSQQRIDNLSDATRKLLERYRAKLWEGQQLQLYTRQLDARIQEQDRRKQVLQEELATLAQTREALVPQLVRMVDTLERFIDLDLPFALEERHERIDRLREVLADPEMSISEQYRRVLEAYQVEVNYGRGLEAERSELEIDGAPRVVDTLRVGRTALYYLTLDGQQGGRWDMGTGDWVDVPPTSLVDIGRGIRIAREQAAPELLRLPLEPQS